MHMRWRSNTAACNLASEDTSRPGQDGTSVRAVQRFVSLHNALMALERPLALISFIRCGVACEGREARGSSVCNAPIGSPIAQAPLTRRASALPPQAGRPCAGRPLHARKRLPACIVTLTTHGGDARASPGTHAYLIPQQAPLPATRSLPRHT